MHHVNTLDASGVHVLEVVLEELQGRNGGIFFSGVNHRVFEVFKDSGLLTDVGEVHIRSSTRNAVRQAMRENFCPAVCAACPVVVFRECTELKKGNWGIFGPGVMPRLCVLPRGKGARKH
jgi:SulP family sulfate permease